MTREQFKCWLAGFVEGVEDGVTPTRRQFDRIMDKLNHELDHEPMDFPAFAHRYFTPYAEHWNAMASEETGEDIIVDMAFVERLMVRNSSRLWQIAGRAEFLSLPVEDQEAA